MFVGLWPNACEKIIFECFYPQNVGFGGKSYLTMLGLCKLPPPPTPSMQDIAHSIR